MIVSEVANEIFLKTSPHIDSSKNTKVKQNICDQSQTTFENGHISTVWPQKGQVPNPGVHTVCEHLERDYLGF